MIQRWKDKGLTPDKVSTGDAGDFANGRAVKLYADYQERLQTLNAADFGDLLLHCLTVFTEAEDVLKDYHSLFRYILVDEYQDTNVAQYLWLRLLAQEQKNICCVGDDDQSIYGWRGAEIGNILKFEKDFPGAKVVRLERNYRSTPQILAAASGLIANNEGRLGKTLWTEAKQGEKLTVRGVWDGEAEARMVGEEVEAFHTNGTSLDEIAVLVRAGFQTREFEERFITLGVPYRVVGGPRFYEREEIRGAIAYARSFVNRMTTLLLSASSTNPRAASARQRFKCCMRSPAPRDDPYLHLHLTSYRRMSCGRKPSGPLRRLSTISNAGADFRKRPTTPNWRRPSSMNLGTQKCGKHASKSRRTPQAAWKT